MPRYESTAGAETGLSSVHAISIISLAVTILLCLPSLVSGAAFVLNLLLYRDIEEWKQTSSALVAMGVFLGSPLVALAAIVGGIATLSGSVHFRIKCAHLFVVSLATIATLLLLFRFRCV